MGLRWDTMPIEASNWKCRVTDMIASADRLSWGSGLKSWCAGIWMDAVRMLLNICIPIAFGWSVDFELF